jgi:hypothetical protein
MRTERSVVSPKYKRSNLRVKRYARIIRARDEYNRLASTTEVENNAVQIGVKTGVKNQ